MTDGSALERACATVARKDAEPLRRALFASKAARTPAIRAALATWERIRDTPLASAFVAGYGARAFATLRPPTSDGSLWTIAEYANEARQLDALGVLVPEIREARATIGPLPRFGHARRALRDADLETARALLDRHVRGGDFLVAARVASTIGYHLRLLPALRRSRARAVLVSSDTNPSALALVSAAEELGLRTGFVVHGHVAEAPPALGFDLAILDGPVVREIYERAGPIRGRVVYRGVEGAVLPMRTAELHAPIDTLGVFLSILVDWERVARAIASLRRALAPRRILVRLHPNREMRDPRWRRLVRERDIVVSEGERPIAEDARACALVASGSSSVHLSALKLGTPSVYLDDLDELAHDYYGFVRERIVPELPGDGRDIARTLASFFEDARWPGRFARFDAGYPDRQEACDREVAGALRDLVRPA